MTHHTLRHLLAVSILLVVFCAVPTFTQAVRTDQPAPFATTDFPDSGMTITAAAGLCSVSDLVIDSPLVYLAMPSGIDIVDLSDPTHPVRLSTTYIPQFRPRGMAVEHPYLYVRVDTGLAVFDVSGPTHPQLLARHYLECTSSGILVRDRIAYIPCGTCLNIYDLSDLSSPTLLSSSTCPDLNTYQNGLKLRGDTLYLSDYNLWVLDVSDLFDPQLISRTSIREWVYDFDLRDSLAILPGDLGMYPPGFGWFNVASIADPTAPEILATLRVDGGMYGARVRGDIAVANNGESGITLWDISTPTSPVLTGCYRTAGIASGMELLGDYAVVADGWASYTFWQPNLCSPGPITNGRDQGARPGDLQIVDIHDPATPVLAGQLRTGGDHQAVVTNGSMVYVADNSGDLTVYDASEEGRLTELGHVVIPIDPQHMFLAGDELFIAHSPDSLSVVNVADPHSPVLVSSWQLPGWPFPVDVAVRESTVFVATFFSDVAIYRRQSGNLIPLATIPEHVAAVSIAVNGDYLYLAGRSGGLVVADVSDPEAPLVIETIPLQGAVRLRLYDTLLFANGAETAVSGLSVFSISDPSHPRLLHATADGEVPAMVDFEYADGFIYGVAYSAGFHVLDAHDLTNISVVQTSKAPYYAYGVAILPNGAVVADVAGVLRYSWPTPEPPPLPRSFTLYQNYPNPFNAGTTIEYDVPVAAHVRLDVINCLGQRVATLVDRSLAPGHYSVGWNGRDREGNEVASGIYLYRLVTGNQVQSRKMILLK